VRTSTSIELVSQHLVLRGDSPRAAHISIPVFWRQRYDLALIAIEESDTVILSHPKYRNLYLRSLRDRSG